MALASPVTPIPIVRPTPDLELPLSPGPTPLLLLPVRLETRFSPLADGGADLRIRVYPDSVHVDGHEPALTPEEATWGRHFWERTWRAGSDADAARLAWHQLVERFERPRAAWIARALTPKNLDELPSAPILDAEPLGDAITFPGVAEKAEAWTRAAEARALPDRWWVMGYAGGALTLTGAGNPIPERVAVGPDPAAKPASPDVVVDEGMLWMTNFAEAERIGMGIRLRLTPEQAAGFDFLLVFGTRARADAGTLAALFDAHHYSRGLGFVRPGTPSNNTEDAPAGFGRADPESWQSFDEERPAAVVRAAANSNAGTLATALGLGDRGTFARLGQATARDEPDALHMNRALWPATWGYFLAQMVGAPLTGADIDWVRAHFVGNVRAFGPLPVLRIGRQPYGVLPTTALRLWRSDAANADERRREEHLWDFLLTLSNVWHRRLGEVPRVGRSANDPDRDFADILSMEAISSSFAIRHLIGEGYLERLWLYLMPSGGSTPRNLAHWWRKRAELAQNGLAAIGTSLTPRMARATWSGESRVLRGPTVQVEIASEDAPLDPNYIDLLLRTEAVDTLRQESFDGGAPRSLLYALLRHGLLLGTWSAAARLRSLGPVLGSASSRPPDVELVDAGSPTPWRLLSEPAPGVTDRPLWDFLRGLDSSPADPAVAAAVTPLIELRQSLSHLSTLRAAQLERLSAGTLDLGSHRLDAWMTSLATRRLREIRAADPTGLMLGGYGWVLNLRPGPTPLPATLPGEPGPLRRVAGDPGYTHAPSLAQAATVAVLRSGHLSHASGAAADILAIDLGSARVRTAAWLIDGVRQGQPLGALLGYRFERRLQETGLAEFIAPFREMAPLIANKMPGTEAPGQPAESVAASNVVDGLILQRLWRAAGTLDALFAGLDRKPDADRLAAAGHALDHALLALDEAIDAVSDALLAESVHQAVQGNPTRTAATLEAIAAGATPPDLDVVRTPRTGVALTHRLVVLLDGSPPPQTAWPTSSARAAAEPRLNAWAAALLPDPSRVRCLVERVDDAGSAEIRLAELGLPPLDLVHATVAGESAPSELELRLLNAAARRLAAPRDALRVARGRGAGWSVDELGFGELAELLRVVQALVTGSRGIDGSELDLPEANAAAGVDIADLAARAEAAAQALRHAGAGLDVPSDDAAALRGRLLRCCDFGIGSAVPVSAAGDTEADRGLLLAQAQGVAREISARLGRLDALTLPAAAPDADAVRHHLARLKIVFGEAFVVLPLFSAGNADELGRALGASTDALGGDPLALASWHARASRVREGADRLDAALRYAEAVGADERLSLRVAQLPFRDGDRWVGLPPLDGAAPSPSRFSLVVQSAHDLDPRRPLAGLLIDEWVEVVPSASETTGIVFQFDQPDAAPPQSLLLAVPPDMTKGWTLHTLQQVLLETIDLARLRLVDPDLLDPVAHYLPAAYFAVNAKRDTVTTDFASLA